MRLLPIAAVGLAGAGQLAEALSLTLKGIVEMDKCTMGRYMNEKFHSILSDPYDFSPPRDSPQAAQRAKLVPKLHGDLLSLDASAREWTRSMNRVQKDVEIFRTLPMDTSASFPDLNFLEPETEIHTTDIMRDRLVEALHKMHVVQQSQQQHLAQVAKELQETVAERREVRDDMAGCLTAQEKVLEDLTADHEPEPCYFPHKPLTLKGCGLLTMLPDFPSGYPELNKLPFNTDCEISQRRTEARKQKTEVMIPGAPSVPESCESEEAVITQAPLDLGIARQPDESNDTDEPVEEPRWEFNGNWDRLRRCLSGKFLRVQTLDRSAAYEKKVADHVRETYSAFKERFEHPFLDFCYDEDEMFIPGRRRDGIACSDALLGHSRTDWAEKVSRIPKSNPTVSVSASETTSSVIATSETTSSDTEISKTSTFEPRATSSPGVLIEIPSDLPPLSLEFCDFLASLPIAKERYPALRNECDNLKKDLPKQTEAPKPKATPQAPASEDPLAGKYLCALGGPKDQDNGNQVLETGEVEADATFEARLQQKLQPEAKVPEDYVPFTCGYTYCQDNPEACKAYMKWSN